MDYIDGLYFIWINSMHDQVWKKNTTVEIFSISIDVWIVNMKNEPTRQAVLIGCMQQKKKMSSEQIEKTKKFQVRQFVIFKSIDLINNTHFECNGNRNKITKYFTWFFLKRKEIYVERKKRRVTSVLKTRTTCLFRS